ncbi:Hypothetical predicted protein [Pelobates cultripes]|uniref:Uncharacterized protein n=1 Tax=Pelobates cultripes TaxID=61616 RepID=A0AAD1T6R1_PELCU|nr:Hypothetical predicted protein [Pelobates cultripes]
MLQAKITELGTKLHFLGAQVQQLEQATDSNHADIQALRPQVSKNSLQISLLHPSTPLSDLDNRGRMNNIRRPKDTAIKLDREHRALKPNGRPDGAPSDIICCIYDFDLTDIILKRAQASAAIRFMDH